MSKVSPLVGGKDISQVGDSPVGTLRGSLLDKPLRAKGVITESGTDIESNVRKPMVHRFDYSAAEDLVVQAYQGASPQIRLNKVFEITRAETHIGCSLGSAPMLIGRLNAGFEKEASRGASSSWDCEPSASKT